MGVDVQGAGAMLLALLIFPAAAGAQHNPGTSADLGAGYGSIALGQSTLDGTRAIGTKGRHGDELSPTMKRYCARWPNEGVCRAARARAAEHSRAGGRERR